MISVDLWQRGCERLAAELPEQQFNTWIRPLPPALIAAGEGGEGLVISLRVPNRFKLDWIRNQYAGRIEAIMSELAGKPARLDLALASREPVGRLAPAAVHQAIAVGQVLHNGLRPVAAPEAPALIIRGYQGGPLGPPPSASRHRINSALTIAGQSGNFELNVMLPLVAHNLLDSLHLLTQTSALLGERAIATFTVNQAHLQDALARNPILVTALNPLIGYARAAAIAKRAYAEGRPILDVAEEDSGLDRATLAQLLDPARLTEGGLSQ